jgi:hypothetical protein
LHVWEGAVVASDDPTKQASIESSRRSDETAAPHRGSSHTATGRLADDVSAEISGPLSDILADTTTLMEDYIGHDDLRHRLQAITDNVVKIRESINIGKVVN